MSFGKSGKKWLLFEEVDGSRNVVTSGNLPGQGLMTVDWGVSTLHIWRLDSLGVIELVVIAWSAIDVAGPGSGGNSNECAGKEWRCCWTVGWVDWLTNRTQECSWVLQISGDPQVCNFTESMGTDLRVYAVIPRLARWR